MHEPFEIGQVYYDTTGTTNDTRIVSTWLYCGYQYDPKCNSSSCDKPHYFYVFEMYTGGDNGEGRFKRIPNLEQAQMTMLNWEGLRHSIELLSEPEPPVEATATFHLNGSTTLVLTDIYFQGVEDLMLFVNLVKYRARNERAKSIELMGLSFGIGFNVEGNVELQHFLNKLGIRLKRGEDGLFGEQWDIRIPLSKCEDEENCQS
ncbi:MAG: hypothetical protein HKN32_05920 [Flavobacteriales bacterium]|nr:hypothetical protein [Flavobacteriales bacterium]